MFFPIRLPTHICFMMWLACFSVTPLLPTAKGQQANQYWSVRLISLFNWSHILWYTRHKSLSVFCAHVCIIQVLSLLSSVLCKQVGKEQGLIYGHITHVIFFFCCDWFVCTVSYRHTNSSIQPSAATFRLLYTWFNSANLWKEGKINKQQEKKKKKENCSSVA